MKICVPKIFVGLNKIHIESKLVLEYEHYFAGVLMNTLWKTYVMDLVREVFIRNEF